MKLPELPLNDALMIEGLIPHRWPMVLLDTILSFDSHNICAGYTIPKDSIFLKNGSFTEAGILEHMAQSAAAYMGYSAFALNENPNIGFIGAIKKATIIRLPKVSERIETEVEILYNAMGMLMIKCETCLQEEIIASSEMKTVLQP